MKTIVFGDIHGRRIWKDIMKIEYDADKYVFLGDYVGTHDRNMTSEQQIDNLNDLLNWAAEMNKYTPGRVILLRGNHDMQHLGYPWASCSGLDWHVQAEMMKLKDRFLDATQWVYVDGNIVYSHAGLSDVWMERNELTDPIQVNDLEPSKVFGFSPCKLSDYHGDSVTQPPTWIRPWGLFQNAFGDYTYIVGHTTYSHITYVKEEMLNGYMESYADSNCPLDEDVIQRIKDANEIIVCDTLGSGEYLIVEDGNFSVGKIEC